MEEPFDYIILKVYEGFLGINLFAMKDLHNSLSRVILSALKSEGPKQKCRE